MSNFGFEFNKASTTRKEVLACSFAASDLVLYGAESGIAVLAPGRQNANNVANVNLPDVPPDHKIHLKVAVLLVQLALKHSSSNPLA